MKENSRGWLPRLLGRGRKPERLEEPARPPEPPRIGLALGGGFARGIAHVGVLRVFERNQIPIHCVTGVSAGSMVAAAFASGASSQEIAAAGASMRFADIARWRIGRMGFAGSERMEGFLRRLLKRYTFEEMALPLGVVATDIITGEPVDFRDAGDVFVPIRASCSYPGLFQPLLHESRLLVDGAMSVEIPAALARGLGATHVVSVHLPTQHCVAMPRNMFQVVNRCFQIMQMRTEDRWKQFSDVVIAPDVRKVEWDGFKSAAMLVEAGEQAALEALPHIKALLSPNESSPKSVSTALAGAALIPGSEPA